MKTLSNFLVYILEGKDKPSINKAHFGEDGLPTAAGYEVIFAVAVNLTDNNKYIAINENTIRQAAEEAGLKSNDIESCVNYFTISSNDPNKSGENRFQELSRKISEMNEKNKDKAILPPAHAVGGKNGKMDIGRYVGRDENGNPIYDPRISMKLPGASRWDSQNVSSYFKDDLSGDEKDPEKNKGILLKIKNKINRDPSKFDKNILTRIDEILKMSRNTESEQNKIINKINSLCNDYPDIKQLYINALVTGKIDPKHEKAVNKILVFDPTYLVWDYKDADEVIKEESKRFENKDILRSAKRTNKKGGEDTSRGVMDALKFIPDEAYKQFGIDPSSIRRTATIKHNGEMIDVVLYNINGKYFCVDEIGNKIKDVKPGAKKLFVANSPERKKDNEEETFDVTNDKGKADQIIKRPAKPPHKGYVYCFKSDPDTTLDPKHAKELINRSKKN